MARDVTERRRAEEALREHRDVVLQILNTMGEGLTIAGPDGRYEYVNPAFARMLGLPSGLLLGKTPFDVTDPADHPILAEARAARLAGQSTTYEVRLLRTDGSKVFVHITGVPRFRDGQMVGSTAVVTDLTERKRAEEIRAAQETAEAAGRAKSEFLSRMSHELRTPLNAILGFGQLLEMDDLKPEQHDNVAHVLRAGRHLLALIDDVLDITRIDAGRLSLLREPVPVRAAMDETLKLVGPLAAEREVRLSGIASRLPDQSVWADPQRLRQVFLNLLSNAVKYNRQGGAVLVNVETRGGGVVRISVSDTGPGIPPERIPQLFIPFERLQAWRQGVEGTGLGLAVSKRIVEAMGGTIGVESVVGSSSTFWVDLPAVGDGEDHRTTARIGVTAVESP